MDSLHRQYLNSALDLRQARQATENIAVLNNLKHPAWKVWHDKLDEFKHIEQHYIDQCVSRLGENPSVEEIAAIEAMKIDPSADLFFPVEQVKEAREAASSDNDIVSRSSWVTFNRRVG